MSIFPLTYIFIYVYTLYINEYERRYPMNDRVRFLKSKGKYSSKADSAFYASASAEDLGRAEKNAALVREWWYEDMEKAGIYGPDNPPPASGLDYHRYLLKKQGLKWYVDYAKKHEYAENPSGIPGRLQALGVPADDIEAILNPSAALRKKNSKICSIANRIKGVSRSEAFSQARRIVNMGNFELRVAGVSFGSRQNALQRLTAYDPAVISVSLVPEPQNPVDKNAVAVMVSVNGGAAYRIGYVPCEHTNVAKAVQGIPHLSVLPGKIYGARVRIAV
jgi:hypothetical protein